MPIQRRVFSTLSSPEGLERLSALVADQSPPHRTALADLVCSEFGFRSPTCAPQRASCLQALRVLDARDLIELPPPLTPGGDGRPRLLGEKVPRPAPLPEQVGQVGGLRVQLVDSAEDRQVYSQLLADEHPRGAVCHAGRQLRYLVRCDEGLVGAIGFAAAALALADRDQWIGWDPPTRRQQLDRVLGLSRFLIREVHCRHLASKVLALCLRRLPDDFRQRYGFAPLLLETFVDPVTHDGACFKAANWTAVGRTAGRGRFAPADAPRRSRKLIFVRPLRPDWRERLGVPDPRIPAPVEPADGLDRDRWAALEFGGAPLGDARLARRLVTCATLQAEAPMDSFPGAAQGARALVKGWYRFLDHPAESALSVENILAPHRERTLGRMQGQDVVLCVQDGTDLNFAEHGGCIGLGSIGKNKHSDGSRGLHLHSTLAVSEAGLPLGVLRMEFDAPEGLESPDPAPESVAEKGRTTKDQPEKDQEAKDLAEKGQEAKDLAEKGQEAKDPAQKGQAGKGRSRKAKPPEERKTQRWVRGLRDCAEVAARLPGTRVVSVMDREADFFELFAEQRRLGGVDLLVRAKHNRNLPPTTGKNGREETPKLFDWLRDQPGQAQLAIDVARVSARISTRNQSESVLREARTAQVTLRWRAVTLPATEESARRGEAPVAAWAVHVAEEAPAGGAKPLEWLLLTSEPVRTQADAERMLLRYRLRWRIEDWHRVLKSGCKVQDLANRTRERLERATAINAVIGWRLHLMVLLGRETPELPAETMFSDIELRVLHDFAQERGKPRPTDVGEAVLLVAVMGGYLQYRRKHYAVPGAEILWKGYVRMASMAQVVERAVRLGRSSVVGQLLRQGP